MVFVLDESGSIGTTTFNFAKSFLSRLVGYLDIDSGNMRVGLVTYSTNVEDDFYLNTHSSVAGIRSAIASLAYRGGNTNTADAVARVRTRMLTSARGGRNNVPNIVVLLYDGQSTSSTTNTLVSHQLYARVL